MKELINRRTIIIFSTALLLAVIAIVSVNVFNTSGPVTGLAYTVTRPIRSLASSVARAFSSIFSAIYEYDQVVARNDELLRQLAEMEMNYRDSQALVEENANLRAQLGFSERYRGYTPTMAGFESWGSDNWSSSFIIDKGSSNSDIASGMAVVTDEGVLIGQVYDVGTNTSSVITILDTKFSASAYVGQTETGELYGGTAVAKGDFTYMNSGMLVLDQISDDLVVRKDDYVSTSGRGGVYPSGRFIGQIVEVYRHENGIGRYATVRPMVNFDTLSNVYVITSFEVTE